MSSVAGVISRPPVSLSQHPVLDEPIAEAVCIIADTDKWSVQVATSQRKVMDSMKLGQEVLVSSQVSSLLQSVLQLYKLRLPADFVSICLRITKEIAFQKQCFVYNKSTCVVFKIIRH